MKKYFANLVALTLTVFIAFSAYAVVKGSPYMPELDSRLNVIEDDVTVLEALPAAATYDVDGLLGLRVVRATIDCGTASNCTVGAHPLGITLPANALLTKSFMFVKTQFASASAGTLAIHCEDANNVLTARNVTSYAASAVVDLNQTGVSGTYTAGIASACALTATVASGDYTAGKGHAIIEYIEHD